MKALVLDTSLAVRDVPIPEPQRDEALIHVRMAGICNTDLELAKGYMDFRGVLGHEFVGEVVECSVPRWIGRRVCAEINLGCGACVSCQRHLARHCSARSVLGILAKDGCFAEYVTLPIANLVEVPHAVPDEVAVFTEPLAAAYEILEQVHVAPDDRVAVLGDGKLGILCALALQGTGAELHVIGKHPHKLDIVGRAGTRVWQWPNHRPSEKFDLVVEATGKPEGLEAALSLVRPRGTVVLKSTFHGATPIALAPVVIDEVTIIGSRCGPFGPAVRALSTGLIDPRPLVTERFALKDALTALEHAKNPRALKVVLVNG